MLTSNTKFIVVALINIIAIILAALYFTGNLGIKKEPFETDFVLDLIEKEKEAKLSIEALNEQLTQVKADINNTKANNESLQRSVEESTNNLTVCEAQKESIQKTIVSGPVKTITTNNCDEISADLAVAQADLTLITQENKKLKAQLTAIEQQLEAKQQELLAAQQLTQQQETEIAQLSAKIKELESYLSTPIALDQNYIGARFCEKPKFEGIICVVEFLVRPTFSKLPVNELTITIRDSKDIIVAKGEFESAQTQMYRFSMGRGKEVTSGNFVVEYNIDNQTLYSEAVSLVQ